MKNLFYAIMAMVAIIMNATLYCMEKMDFTVSNIVFMIGMWIVLIIGFKALFMVANSKAAKREMRRGRR